MKTVNKFASVLVVLSLIGCGSSGSGNPSETKVETTSSIENYKATDFDGSSCSDTGNGTFGVVNESGSSLDGAEVVVFVENPKTDLIQIGFESQEFDGSCLTFIYIDGALYTKEQLGETQGTLTLVKDALAEGKHLVEAVQFENDEPDGTVKCYKSAPYTVKLK